MTDIPRSSIVRVTIATSPTFPSRAGFGTLNVVGSSTIINAQVRALAFSGIDEVTAAGFPTSSEEYIAANTYFSQSPKPARVIISRRVITALPPEVRGGANPSVGIATWQAITDGSFAIDIGGDSENITGLDFSSDTSFTDVAATIQAAMRTAGALLGADWTASVCEYVSSENRFYIRGGETGSSATISFVTAAPSGTFIGGSDLAALDQANASRSDGLDAEIDVSTSLSAIENANSDWYGFVVTSELRDQNTEIGQAAAWAEARVKVFGNDSDNNGILDSTITTDIATVLRDASRRRTMTCYNGTPGQYLAASALGQAFVVNFNQPNTTLTLKFKQMPGITVAALRTSDKEALDAKRANAYFTVGVDPMFGEGFMGSGVFFDEVHGIDWLQNAIETNVFGKLYTDTTKTAMTDPGAASLQQRVEAALEQGRINGLLAAGVDNNGDFLAKGYVTSVVRIVNHDEAQRQNRQGPPISFTALGAGAIHGIQVDGTFER